MKKTHAVKALAVAAAMALIAVPAAVAAAPKPATVSVQVEGKSKTLLAARSVTVSTGSVTKGGVAAGKCPADTAQGALNVATHGHWSGTWDASYKEYFITAILGERETGKKYYWGFYVNGKAASKGACDVTLKTGEKILFKVTKA